MHKIQAKEFTLEDFSIEHLVGEGYIPDHEEENPYDMMMRTINTLNYWRNAYLNAEKIKEETGLDPKDIWWQMIQLLPPSYNQKRTVMLNYEVLHNIYFSRKDHKLDEWHVFCDWIERLPYSEIIIGEKEATNA